MHRSRTEVGHGTRVTQDELMPGRATLNDGFDSTNSALVSRESRDNVVEVFTGGEFSQQRLLRIENVLSRRSLL